jgi:tetratricopeptide (TPR) repeat protein
MRSSEVVYLAFAFGIWILLGSGCDSPPADDPLALTWKRHYQTGVGAVQKGQHTLAEEELQQALSVARRLPEGNARLENTLDQLAGLCLLRGQEARAESLYLHLLSIQKEHRGAEDEKTASTLEKLADLCRKRSETTHAESLYLHLLSIRDPRRRDQVFASTLSKLADLYHKRDEFTRADSLAKRAMGLKIHAQGHQHFILGQDRQAEILYQRALTVQKRNLNENHSDLAMTCFDLGRLYDVQGSFQQAEAFYRRSLTIQEKNLGMDHKGLMEILDPLAALLKRVGKSAEATILKTRIDSISTRSVPH